MACFLGLPFKEEKQWNVFIRESSLSVLLWASIWAFISITLFYALLGGWQDFFRNVQGFMLT